MRKWIFQINILIILIYQCISTVNSSKATRNIEITAEEEQLRDPEGYLAIKAIHAILDDDHSGSIDRTESADFLAEDLKFADRERERREKTFHENDESITVDDLWESWFESEERGWDQKQVIDWLANTVKLPQYANIFMTSKVSGLHLPRMAVQNSTFLNTLGIKSFVHRQKIQLKALDLVLFGAQDSSSLLKDIVLAGLLAILVTVLILFKTHKNRSKKQMEELSTRLCKLHDMETDFEGVQQKLDDETRKRQSADDEVELYTDTNQLHNLEIERERRIDETNGIETLPFSLQTLLRRTYEIESTYLNQQKFECLHEMKEAKDLVDKMRRKQTSIVNSLKLATGATSGTGDIDTKIFNLKTRMEKIKLAVEELSQRWTEIESICGFTITGPFGIVPAAQSLDNINTLLAIKYQIEQSTRASQQQQQHSNPITLEQHHYTNNVHPPPITVQNGQMHSASDLQFILNKQMPSVERIPQSESASVISVPSSVQNKKVNRLRKLFQRKPK